MIPTKPYNGTVQIEDGKIKAMDLSLPEKTLTEIQQIMALRHILDNHVKEFERDQKRRI